MKQTILKKIITIITALFLSLTMLLISCLHVADCTENTFFKKIVANAAWSSAAELESYALNNWTKPIQANYADPNGGLRYFGADRSGTNRKHAANDYVCDVGTPVYAMTGGYVEEFSGNFYAGTQAISVKNDDGSVARYCEIGTSLHSGDRVEKGQQIGTVIANTSSARSHMLHLELYLGTASGSLSNTSNHTYWYVDYKNYCRRQDLIDPTFVQRLETDIHNDDELGIGYPRPSGSPSLSAGSRGSGVSWLQTALNKANNAGLSVDGIYGAGTKQAVINFQNKYGLAADGIAGVNTINKLVEVLKGNSTELVTPSISFDKSSYIVGDTVNISWTPSPSGSNLSHYWLNVIAPDGTWVYGGTMNLNTSYSFTVSQEGNYSITTYATPKGSLEGEGSLTDSKLVSVINPKWYSNLTPVNLGDSFYAKIRNQTTNWYFTADSGNVIGLKGESTNRQLWKFERQSDGSYKIVNVDDGGCMDVTNYAHDGNGTNVQTWVDNAESAQRYYVYWAYNSYYIKPLCTDLFVDMSLSDGNISVWDSGEDWAPQKFDIIKTDTDGYMPVNIGDSFYAKIRNHTANWYFTNDSGNVIGLKGENSDRQLWKFERQPDNSYKIITKVDGKSCMDVTGSAYEGNGTNVQIWEDNSEMAQRYFIYEAYGAYYIKPVCTHLMVDMSQSDGNVSVWDYGKDWSPQKFDILKIDMDGYMPVNIGDNFYAKIQNLSTKYYFTNNEGNVIGMKNENSNRQLWKFERQPDNSYKIITKVDEKSCMDVTGSAYKGNGTNVQIWEDNSEMAQRYFIYEAYGAYYIKPVCTHLMVDMSQSDGNVSVWDYGKDWSPQMFNIEKQFKGDANNDGKVTTADAVILQKWLLAVPDTKLANWKATDMNEDGMLNIFDLVLLKRELLNQT